MSNHFDTIVISEGSFLSMLDKFLAMVRTDFSFISELLRTISKYEIKLQRKWSSMFTESMSSVHSRTQGLFQLICLDRVLQSSVSFHFSSGLFLLVLVAPGIFVFLQLVMAPRTILSKDAALHVRHRSMNVPESLKPIPSRSNPCT